MTKRTSTLRLRIQRKQNEEVAAAELTLAGLDKYLITLGEINDSNQIQCGTNETFHKNRRCFA